MRIKYDEWRAELGSEAALHPHKTLVHDAEAAASTAEERSAVPEAKNRVTCMRQYMDEGNRPAAEELDEGVRSPTKA